MIVPLRPALVVMLVAGAGVAGCGPRRVQTPGTPGDLIVLMGDPNGGASGRATVTSGANSAELAKPGEYTIVGINQPPTRVSTMNEADLKRQFAEVLAAMPPAPERFTLFFRFESDELTEESRALVPDVLAAMKGRPVPEVAVTGHTDTTGSTASNYDLGMKRANMVRSLLLDAGLDPGAIEVTSHGEAVLLVKTGDEMYEPRNRRVEITIR
ncbi:MAG TPA: OmpA family protein [Vicinamibacterales bacterium]|nr:OmpA family protein [Vicinamibacterales bacterium]